MRRIAARWGIFFGSSSTILLCSAILSVTLCFIPVFIHIPEIGHIHPVKDERILTSMESEGYRDAIISNIAVAVPVAADFIIDIVTTILTSRGSTLRTTSSYLPRAILVASLFVPTLTLLCVAFPMRNTRLMCCIFLGRIVTVFYAVLGHLWEQGGTYFRSVWFLFGSLLIYCAFVLGCWDCISSSAEVTLKMDLAIALMCTAVAIITAISIPWLYNMKSLGIMKMSTSQISCTANLLLLACIGSYFLITTAISSRSLDYFDAPFLTAYMYVEAGFTVTLTLLQSRLTRDTLKTLEDVECACGESLDILNDLLSYEKLEAGIMTLEKIHVNAWAFLETAIRPFVMQARNMNITLILPPETDTQALQHTTLFIDLHQFITDRIIDKEGNRSSDKIKLLRIQVKDHGAGIAKSKSKSVMERMMVSRRSLIAEEKSCRVVPLVIIDVHTHTHNHTHIHKATEPLPRSSLTSPVDIHHRYRPRRR
eukprot:gene3862-7708_t